MHEAYMPVITNSFIKLTYVIGVKKIHLKIFEFHLNSLSNNFKIFQ